MKTVFMFPIIGGIILMANGFWLVGGIAFAAGAILEWRSYQEKQS